MRRTSRATALAVGVGLLLAAGCNDRLPTLSGTDPLPGGLATTIEHILETAEFLTEANVFTGNSPARQLSTFVVARDFDGALQAHTLTKLRQFPDTVRIGSDTDSMFTYRSSRVFATVPDTLKASHTELVLSLWAVAQPWDSSAVSWENAVDLPEDPTPWAEPGGTRGELIDQATWIRAASGAVGDSIFWDVPASFVERLATREVPGLMVTLDTPNSRIHISALSLEASIQPSVQADTVVTRTLSSSAQTSIFTPDAPAPDDVLRVGGMRADRSVVRLDLPTRAPLCEAPQSCGTLPFEDMAINRVELQLTPIPVAAGFRPVGTIRLTVRSVLQPELGERAPVGPVVSVLEVQGSRFTELDAEPISFAITEAVIGALRDKRTDVAFAILVEPEASSFGYAWLAPDARLRFLYTLPQAPDLP